MPDAFGLMDTFKALAPTDNVTYVLSEGHKLLRWNNTSHGLCPPCASYHYGVDD